MEENIREAENINAIALLASATAINRDNHANLSGTVVYMMAELMLANTNTVEALKENTRLKRVLVQCQKRTRSGGRALGKGVTSQQKKGAHYC